MSSRKKTARIAGLLYLLSGLPGVFSYVYVPSTLLASTDATLTAERVANAALTYRLGIASDIVGQVLLVLVVLALYELFADIDRRYARLMVALVLIGVTVEMTNVLNLVAPLILWSGAESLSVFTKPQLDALALAFLRLRGGGLFVVQIFWGLWLLPFGLLVIKSGFLPRVLGVLLILACLGYVAASLAYIVSPAYVHPSSHLSALVGGVGEGAMILWLLIKGAEESTPGPVPTPPI